MAAELIHDSLKEKTFLIVLDDVWRATKQNNLIESLGVPAANTRSKIVVTTRDRAVCEAMGASFIYHMEVLNEEDSWNLFCVYAFPDDPENRPPQHLKELAVEVESKCGKLPLALKTVGASMANQTLVRQWESKLQKLKAVKKPEDPFQEILQLSYDSLPVDLKDCFLYFAFFGEDERIDVEYLLELWRAEGFISGGDDGWEIGLNYFYQLSNLCLVEAWEDTWLHKYCRIHDLLRDLAISICKESACGFSFQEGCTKYSSCTQYVSQPDKRSGSRRLFLAKQGIVDDDILDSMLLFPTFLRTLSLGSNDKLKHIPARLFKEVRALRVLDLRMTSISTLPSSIGCSKLLTLLNLSFTEIKDVPECIRRLKNLRVLKMMTARRRIERVPEWVSELKCLENLEIRAKSMPKTVSELFSLRVLCLYDVELSVEENGLLRLEDVGNLIGLQKLHIEINWEAELERMKEGVLERLVNVRWLRLRNWIARGDDGDVVLHFSDKFKSMTHLEYLTLRGFDVPSCSIREFANLRFLRLYNCEWSEYAALESLPNLLSLQLEGNKKCGELFEKRWAFPKLRFLEISDFRMLEEFVVLEGCMPCLEKFELSFCERLARVEGLEHLKSVQIFSFSGSGTDECKEKLKEGGEEWKKIKANNSRVQIYF